MAKGVKRVGIGTVALGAFDWFARYQTVKDLVASGTTAKVAEIAATWWVSPLLIVIGFLLLYADKLGAMLHSEDAAISPPPPSNTAKVENSGNTTGTGGNAAITQNFVLGDLAKPKPEPQPPPKTKEKRIELTALAIIKKLIALDAAAEVWRFESGPNRSVARALLLPFYFDPIASDPVYSIEYVRAHLRFTADTGEKILVDHGCWVNSSLDYVNIHPGEKKHLIVAMVAEGEYAAINTNRTNHDLHLDNEAFDLIPLVSPKSKLEVVLIRGGGGQFKRVYDLNIDLDQLSKLLPS